MLRFLRFLRGKEPATGSERRFRRHELFGLANGAFLFAALAFILLCLPPSPWRLAGFCVLLVSAAVAVALRHRFWTDLEDELRRRKHAEQEARAAEIVKGRFLADVSHEIRTPMNGILGMTELLLQEALTPGQKEKVELVRTSAESLLTLVGDILDLSRIEAGKLQLREQDYRLRPLVRDVLRLLAPRAAERRVEINLQVDPTLPDDLHGDPVRLRQVFLNLVGNAVRFTRDGTVTVSLKPLGSGNRINLFCEVLDTGVGIRPEVQARLFQPFSQSDSVSRQLGGSGLGLVISKNVVDLMGGEIGFKSTYGVGSSFWFRVPLRPAQAARSEPETDLRAHRKGLRVLAVDDQYVNRTVTRSLLEELGFSADAAESGEAALAMLDRHPYDAVLLDCQMPGLDGFETCRRLRQKENGTRHTVVIAVTADTLADDLQRCHEAGMDDHMAKPLWSADLAAMLDRHLASRPRMVGSDQVRERIEALGRLGDKELQADVVRAFLEQSAHDLGVLRSALTRNDAKALSAAAHALSGSSGILGGRNLAELAGEMSSLARKGDLSACAQRLPALERELQAFTAELSL